MTRVTIKTYKDLLEEKERLQTQLAYQKTVIRNDIASLKEEFSPIRTAVGFLGKFTKRDKSGNFLMNFASSRVVDLLLRKVVLARAGWLTRLAVPFLAKNFSSHLVADNKNQILGKLATWFNKMRGHKVPKQPTRRQEPFDVAE